MRGRSPDKGQIQEIIKLRSHGYSLPEISNITGISKSTTFKYIRGIQILPDYISKWSEKRGGSKKRKLLKEQEAFKDGKRLVGKLSRKELYILLTALYWSEGNKKDFSLTNTDPYLIRVFIEGLREIFNVSNDKIRVSIRIYEDLDRENCIDYWSKVVGISRDGIASVNVLSGNKKGKLEYGMCRIRVLKGGDLLKKINGMKKAVINLYAPIA